MGELIAALIPEFIGLVITPGAIAGCVLLLQSRRPIPNAAAFGGAFLLLYALIAATALLGGASEPDATSKAVAHWTGLIVGVLFLAVGIWFLTQPADPAPPKWLTQLESATPSKAFVFGIALAVINPNLFIMMSGMSIISSSAVGTGAALTGTVLLLLSATLDFLVPIGLFAALGERARSGLEATKQWMLQHNRVMSICVLMGFGTLFTIRGIANIG